MDSFEQMRNELCLGFSQAPSGCWGADSLWGARGERRRLLAQLGERRQQLGLGR